MLSTHQKSVRLFVEAKSLLNLKNELGLRCDLNLKNQKAVLKTL